MKAGPAAGLRRTWLRAIDLVQARLDRTPDGTPGSDGPDGPDPRRSWPQRLLIAFNVLFVVGLLLVAVRLNSFEEAVGSIIRIDVPAGVLADLVDTEAAAAAGTGDTDDDRADTADKPDEQPAGPPRNFLIIGTDSAIGLDLDDPASHRDRTTGVALADVIMLLRLDPGLARASLVSLPRDLYVPIYRDGVPVREEKIASALLVGGMEQGAPTLVETVTHNFDVPIHNFVVIDFFGFEKVVDEIDGVQAWFPYPVRDVASGLYELEAGCTLLDGRASLAYVRSRKPEAFVDGRWRRVGVWNDLERNQRQQGFMILAMERVIAKGARSVFVRDDLIEVAAGAVILDDRLTLRDLLSLGQSFADFDPDDLRRYVLPVYDDLVGASSVLRLQDDARSVFDVFRGVALRPAEVPVVVVDGRGPVDESIPAYVQLERKGFPVEVRTGPVVERTTIRATVDLYDGALLVGQFINPVPRFEFSDDAGDSVELTLGTDFAIFRLVPRTYEEVDAIARAALPGVPLDQAAVVLDGPTPDLSTDQPADVALVGPVLPPVPMRAAATTGGPGPMDLVDIIDARPPDGVTCR